MNVLRAIILPVLTLLFFGGLAAPSVSAEGLDYVPPILVGKMLYPEPKLALLKIHVPAVRPCNIVSGALIPTAPGFVCTIWFATGDTTHYWVAVHDMETVEIKDVFEVGGGMQKHVWP